MERHRSGLSVSALRNAPVTRQLGDIVYRSVGSLHAYVNNPRKHPEKQIVKLMASISEFGFAMPALVDDSGLINVGAGRIEAAKRLGIEEVPCIVASDWSDAKVRAYRIADNRLGELASWDDALLAIEQYCHQ